MPRHPSGSLIPQGFFLRSAEEVAADLLGRHVVALDVTLRIVEVEAYGGPEDSASHCRHGRTPRNAPMWGPGGHAYVYLCYGLHWMLNVVVGESDQGGAVLIRACEVAAGRDRVRERRGQGPERGLVSGPGKVGQALGLYGGFNGHPLFREGPLELREGEPTPGIHRTPRIGIGFATPADQEALRRFLAVT